MATATTEMFFSFLQGPDAGPLELKGIRETVDSIYLGAVGLSLEQPLFHSSLGFNFSGRISPDAGFRVETITHPQSGRVRLVAVFQQFKTSPFQDFPEDIVMGWVAASEGEALATWMGKMDDQLARLLKLRAAEASAE